MRNALILALVCIFSAGCTSSGGTQKFRLDPQYDPLKYLKPRSAFPGLSSIVDGEDVITTIGDSAYVEDVDKWLAKRPVNGVRFRAVMRHEQEHSKRQFAMGKTKWINKYLFDKKFALEEEKIGWYWQIKTLRDGGQSVNVNAVAAALANYRNALGRITNFNEALAWVKDVMAGRWKPPAD